MVLGPLAVAWKLSVLCSEGYSLLWLTVVGGGDWPKCLSAKKIIMQQIQHTWFNTINWSCSKLVPYIHQFKCKNVTKHHIFICKNCLSLVTTYLNIYAHPQLHKCSQIWYFFWNIYISKPKTHIWRHRIMVSTPSFNWKDTWIKSFLTTVFCSSYSMKSLTTYCG